MNVFLYEEALVSPPFLNSFDFLEVALDYYDSFSLEIRRLWLESVSRKADRIVVLFQDWLTVFVRRSIKSNTCFSERCLLAVQHFPWFVCFPYLGLI